MSQSFVKRNVIQKIFSMVAVATALLLGSSPLGWADDDEHDEQPLNEVFQTELVYPQEAGEVQLSYAPRFRQGQEQNRFMNTVGLEYGLTDAWQIELEWDSFVQQEHGADGIGDFAIGTKYSFMHLAGSTFHVAVQLELSFPIGDVDKELSEGFLEVEPSLILAKDFPDFYDLQLFTQIGLGVVDRLKTPAEDEDKEPSAHEFSWSSGFFLPLPWAVVSTELSWTTNTWNSRGEEEELFVTPGIVRTLGNGWEVGVGVPIGLTAGSDDFQVISHLIYEF